MNKAGFLARLRQAVSIEEWDALGQNDRLPVSDFNRSVLLELRDLPVPAEGEVDMVRASGLYETLRDYLTEYMAEQPEGWKYIILACLYLTFLSERPMHPIDRLGIRVTEGGTVYECPQKSPLKKTACAYCVCRSMSRNRNL